MRCVNLQGTFYVLLYRFKQKTINKNGRFNTTNVQ